jgi:SAM-dependent methyltransferase
MRCIVESSATNNNYRMNQQQADSMEQRSAAAKMLSLIACSKCHQPISLLTDHGACASCGTAVMMKNGVLVTEEFSKRSYFDAVFQVMREGNREESTWKLFYQQQAQFVSDSLRDGDIVIDVGCGPELPYAKKNAFVIGVDASYDSIRTNTTVDLRVYASAAAMPLRTGVADKMICFYSVHHMTGDSISENRQIVREVFREFARVLKPSGRLLIFEVTPRWPFATFEDISWNAARSLLGTRLDMYFWSRQRLVQLAAEDLPGARLNLHHFKSSALATFPPIFSKPSLRVPRFMYPFSICLYEWNLSESS